LLSCRLGLEKRRSFIGFAGKYLVEFSLQKTFDETA
jgi:hypothetical protein